MLEEDSNGESSFEIIDKKNQLSDNTGKPESVGTLSGVSSPYSIPSPSLVNQPGGNLLSNVAPPSSIPDFTFWPLPTSVAATPSFVPPTVPQAVFTQPHPVTPTGLSQQLLAAGSQFPSTQFSAAIPPSKGVLHGPIAQQPAGENEGSSAGFMGLFKEAFSSGGVLSKMAEKAKSSVDSIITTLDPQMSEYIYSGGDTEVTVASESDDDVAAIREAFHSSLGKAWVNGIKLNLPPKKSQTVGFDSGFKNAEEKIAYSLKFRNTPTVVIENILLQQCNDWYDLSILVLRDAEKQITVQTFSQATPVPVDQFLKEIDVARPDLKSLSVEDKLATYVQAKPDWQLIISGVPRKEVILLAGKTLVRIYKNQLSLK